MAIPIWKVGPITTIKVPGERDSERKFGLWRLLRFFLRNQDWVWKGNRAFTFLTRLPYWWPFFKPPIINSWFTTKFTKKAKILVRKDSWDPKIWPFLGPEKECQSFWLFVTSKLNQNVGLKTSFKRPDPDSRFTTGSDNWFQQEESQGDAFKTRRLPDTSRFGEEYSLVRKVNQNSLEFGRQVFTGYCSFWPGIPLGVPLGPLRQVNS